MSPQMLFVMAFAFTLSLAFTGFMIHVGVGDVPDRRSNHTQTTPTSGGLGIIAGLGGLFLILPQFYMAAWFSPEWPMVLSLMFAVGLLGLIDDAYNVSPGIKFFLLLLFSVIAVRVIGPVTIIPYASAAVELPYIVGFAGSVLWVFVVTNAVNFMDGSNGLMALVMSVACLALMAIGAQLGAFEAVLIPAGLLAGLAGFMPYNLKRKAHIFSGDAGSLFTGFGFALAILWLCRESGASIPVFIGPFLVLPFLTDVLLTLLRRWLHKEPLLQAHKTHIYQRYIARGYSHIRVAYIYAGASALMGLLAYSAVLQGFQKYTAFLLLPVLFYVAIYYALANKLKTHNGIN